MKYYRFWIADFESKTNALSNSQRGIYLLLLNHCYMHERGLPADLATIFLISRVTSEPERADVMLVLTTYFDRQDGGTYQNKKAEQMLSEMREYSEAQKERSMLGVAARQAKNEPKQAKKKLPDKKAEPVFTLPEWVPQAEWSAWMDIRKAKKAINSPYALQCALTDLERLRAAGDDPKAILRAAIGGSWKSLHAPTERVIAQTAKSNGAAPWWSSNDGIKAKADELGIGTRPGESWADLKGRINKAIDNGKH